MVREIEEEKSQIGVVCKLTEVTGVQKEKINLVFQRNGTKDNFMWIKQFCITFWRKGELVMVILIPYLFN